MSLIDDFNILELPTNATEQEAKAAYRRLARRYHPDKNPNQDTTEHFQRIHDAYQNVLAAIRQSQGQQWQPYSFTEQASRGATRSDQAPNHFDSDAKQREYVKEQQRAYQDMKRENASHERAREEALRTARSTLHQRRMHALYEEMRKADQHKAHNNQSDWYSEDQDRNAQYDFAQHSDKASDANGPQPEVTPQSVRPLRLHAAKAAFIATTYIGVFAAGGYATLYWQDHQNSSVSTLKTPYISGLYPQFRSGSSHTLNDARLFTEPSVASEIKTTIPVNQDVRVQRMDGEWLTLSYENYSGWAKVENLGFGSFQHAQSTGCLGQPGLAPRHGAVIGATVEGNSRLRIVNQQDQASLLRFQSLDGQAPFSIYLQAQQPFAANFIPRGRYRLVLETGSLYHHACQSFLFDKQQRIVMDSVNFAGTEQSLTLRNTTSQ
ncbi:DnaJ domain-containing protein [Marinomonas ostreistagni]|nr:DnaJ domain-containing protein [Marinomonas ostreistagni]